MKIRAAISSLRYPMIIPHPLKIAENLSRNITISDGVCWVNHARGLRQSTDPRSELASIHLHAWQADREIYGSWAIHAKLSSRLF